jgi:hypothetical protein
MLENIIANAVGGLIVSLILEWLRSRRGAPAVRASDAASAPMAVRPRRAKSPFGAVLRVVFSLVIGFFGSGIVAGFIEGGTGKDGLIKFGDPTMIGLMALCTAFGWLLLAGLSRRG